MDVPSRRLVSAVVIYILGVLLVAFSSYYLERERYLEDIDARLYAAASNLPNILPADFHDIARTPDAISPEQDKYNLELLTRHAKSADMTYIYSYVMVDGMIYFTTCNYTEDDIKNDQVVTYWTDYPEGDKKYFDAMSATEAVYVTAGDRWGLFRTILLPLKSPGGLPYIAAADMDITVIEQALLNDLMAVLGLGLILIVIVVPLVWAYHRTFSEMNRELQGLNEQLQEDIKQARVLEVQLKEAKNTAEAASRVKSQFLSNMSHELRTPINGIIGVNQLMQETRLDGEQQEYLALSDQSAQILLDTVNQILDTAAIEANGMVLRPEPIDTQVFFEEISQLFSAQIAAKQLDLIFNLDEQLPRAIKVDPVRFRQIFINLIANAVKFTQRGGVSVSVSWQNGQLQASIQDTGIGIPGNKQQKIFEIFHQIESSYSRSHDGSGLGLSIAQKICELMDGELRLEHSDDHGSRFGCRVMAPSLGDGVTITPVELEHHRQWQVTLAGATEMTAEWFRHQLPSARIECLSPDEIVQRQSSTDLIVVDAGLGDEVVARLLERIVDYPGKILLLSWAGQHPPYISDRTIMITKPLLRSALIRVL